MTTYGWMRKNVGQSGRVARAMAGGALVGGSYLIGGRWVRAFVAALGGMMAIEAAAGVSLSKVAVRAIVEKAERETEALLAAEGLPYPEGILTERRSGLEHRA